MNELQQLKDNILCSWATLDLPQYGQRLAALYAACFLLLGGPIAAQTFDPADQVRRLAAGPGSWRLPRCCCCCHAAAGLRHMPPRRARAPALRHARCSHGPAPLPPTCTTHSEPINQPTNQPLEFFLSGSTGSLLVVAVAALRIYLAWAYVGGRLLTASLEYEETGWCAAAAGLAGGASRPGDTLGAPCVRPAARRHGSVCPPPQGVYPPPRSPSPRPRTRRYDGQVFVKPPEVLARDRLLGTYEVRPVLARLRTTLQAVGVGLAGTALALSLLISSQLDADGAYGRGSARKLAPTQVTPTGAGSAACPSAG